MPGSRTVVSDPCVSGGDLASVVPFRVATDEQEQAVGGNPPHCNKIGHRRLQCGFQWWGLFIPTDFVGFAGRCEGLRFLDSSGCERRGTAEVM